MHRGREGESRITDRQDRGGVILIDIEDIREERSGLARLGKGVGHPIKERLAPRRKS